MQNSSPTCESRLLCFGVGGKLSLAFLSEWRRFLRSSPLSNACRAQRLQGPYRPLDNSKLTCDFQTRPPNCWTYAIGAFHQAEAPAARPGGRTARLFQQLGLIGTAKARSPSVSIRLHARLLHRDERAHVPWPLRYRSLHGGKTLASSTNRGYPLLSLITTA